MLCAALGTGDLRGNVVLLPANVVLLILHHLLLLLGWAGAGSEGDGGLRLTCLSLAKVESSGVVCCWLLTGVGVVVTDKQLGEKGGGTITWTVQVKSLVSKCYAIVRR